MALFSQGVQIALVSVLIGGFFVLLGMLLVDEATTLDWAGQVHVIATISLGQQDLVLTEQLLRVAGFFTAFSGLNFTVYLVTDLTYRREFRGEVVGELRQAFAVHAVYRAGSTRIRGRRRRPWLPPLRLRRPDGERATRVRTTLSPT